VIRTVGVVGLGAMGAGIAQLAIEAGFDTVGHEVDAVRGEAAGDRISHFLTRKVEKGQLDQEARDAAVGRLALTTELADPAWRAATSSSRRSSRSSVSSTRCSVRSRRSSGRRRSSRRTRRPCR